MKLKKWEILNKFAVSSKQVAVEKLLLMLLKNRGIITKKDREKFLNPQDPYSLTAKDVGINEKVLNKALKRIQKAIDNKESIVVYADYDADGVTAGTIMWETLHKLGAKVKPYIPHRVDEGYGFSVKGIDNVISQHNPTLIISVDHGVTAREKIKYAKEKGIDIVVTDHHVLPAKLPDCTLVHTTQLAGAGVAWFVAKELLSQQSSDVSLQTKQELLALAAIGTIGDMVPLVGANRAIAKYGLAALNQTGRVGLIALYKNAGITQGNMSTYEVSFMIVPRLNAMGRIVHALDAMRLLCASNPRQVSELAEKLGSTNRNRQQILMDTTFHARDYVELQVKSNKLKKLLFVSHEEYNQGVIGLVAGKLVEQYYRPAIVVAKGEIISKASARSITGFNIIEAIRSCSEFLIDCGGHPMAAGFTVETKNLKALQEKLEAIAEGQLDDGKLTRVLKIDAEIGLENANRQIWEALRSLEPFGMGNPEPVFATKKVAIRDLRLIGNEGKHLKLHITSHVSHITLDAIGFGMGKYYGDLKIGQPIDIAYCLDLNEWNGNTTLQLKLKDIHV